MKKALFFVPSVLVGLIYLFLLFAVGGWQDGENWLGAAFGVRYLVLAVTVGVKGAKGKKNSDSVNR